MSTESWKTRLALALGILVGVALLLTLGPDALSDAAGGAGAEGEERFLVFGLSLAALAGIGTLAGLGTLAAVVLLVLAARAAAKEGGARRSRRSSRRRS